MMWFKRLIAKWANEGQYHAEEVEMKAPSIPRPFNGPHTKVDRLHDVDELSFKKPTHITLYKVNGGHIVKFTHWIPEKDETYESTYIITNDEELAESLAKYIAVEAMKDVRQ